MALERGERRADSGGAQLGHLLQRWHEEVLDHVGGPRDVLRRVPRLVHRHALTPADGGGAVDGALEAHEQHVAVELRAERGAERPAQRHPDAEQLDAVDDHTATLAITAFPGHAGRGSPLLGWRLVARTPTMALR